jgi:hypothetical protein
MVGYQEKVLSKFNNKLRAGGEPGKRRDYLPPEKQYLVTKNGNPKLHI